MVQLLDSVYHWNSQKSNRCEFHCKEHSRYSTVLFPCFDFSITCRCDAFNRSQRKSSFHTKHSPSTPYYWFNFFVEASLPVPHNLNDLSCWKIPSFLSRIYLFDSSPRTWVTKPSKISPFFKSEKDGIVRDGVLPHCKFFLWNFARSVRFSIKQITQVCFFSLRNVGISSYVSRPTPVRSYGAQKVQLKFIKETNFRNHISQNALPITRFLSSPKFSL